MEGGSFREFLQWMRRAVQEHGGESSTDRPFSSGSVLSRDCAEDGTIGADFSAVP